MSLADANPPAQAGHREEARRLETVEVGEDFPPPPLQHPILAHSSHPFLRSSKIMGPRIRVSPRPQRSKLFLGTVETKGGFLCPTMQLEVRRWLLLFSPLRVVE